MPAYDNLPDTDPTGGRSRAKRSLVWRALGLIGSAVVGLIGAVGDTTSEIVTREDERSSPYLPDESAGYAARITHPPDDE